MNTGSLTGIDTFVGEDVALNIGEDFWFQFHRQYNKDLSWQSSARPVYAADIYEMVEPGALVKYLTAICNPLHANVKSFSIILPKVRGSALRLKVTRFGDEAISFSLSKRNRVVVFGTMADGYIETPKRRLARAKALKACRQISTTACEKQLISRISPSWCSELIALVPFSNEKERDFVGLQTVFHVETLLVGAAYMGWLENRESGD